MIQVRYFASLREALGRSSESVDPPPSVTTVAALRDHLAARGEPWNTLGTARNLRAAVNQDMVGMEAPVAAGDEVAFFPPVTGG